jgi:hypothetical protein
MPRYFKPWEQGIPELRKQLKKVDQFGIFTKAQLKTPRERMTANGLAPDQPTTLLMSGRTGFVLAVFDQSTWAMKAIISPD